MLQSGMPDFYIPDMAYHSVKNKDFSVATVLCDTKVKNCLLSNFIKVLTYLLIFRKVLPVLQFFSHFCKILNPFYMDGTPSISPAPTILTGVK